MFITEQDNVTPQMALPVHSLTKIPQYENHMTPSHLSTKTAYHNEVDPSLPSYEDAMAMSTSLHI